jgi:predicted transcriptional regulator
MPRPEGSLTPSQFEILHLLWEAPDGLTVADLWDLIRVERDVSRTTILNLVDRLEKRHWLTREKVDGVFRYSPTMDRQATEAKLADDFVGEFFNGSPASFVLSLLGSHRISRSELKRIKSMINDSQSSTPRQGDS